MGRNNTSNKAANNQKEKEKEEEEEDPFSLIEKGNSLKSSRNEWGSSDYYGKASSVLLAKYHALNNGNDTTTTNDDDKTVKRSNSNPNSDSKKEQQMIMALYHDQSVEYLNKARQSLIGALMFEREEDLKRWGDTTPMVEVIASNSSSNISSTKKEEKEQIKIPHQFDPLMTMLTDEQMDRRIDTFRRIFVTPIPLPASKPTIASKPDPTPSLVVSDNVSKNHDIKSFKESNISEINEEKSNEQCSIVTECNKVDSTNKDGEITTNDDIVSSLEERLSKLVVPEDNKLEPPPPQQQQPHHVSKIEKDTNNNQINQVELTLEQRLANLDSTLPKRNIQKSDDERLENIKSGLDELGGVYMPSSSSSGNNKKSSLLLDHDELSEDGQIQLIMNMAKDEVALDKSSGGNDGEDDDDASSYDAVEDIMKRSGIRFELPLEEDSNGMLQIIDPNEEEEEGEEDGDAFWTSMKTIRDSNNEDIDDLEYDDIDIDDDIKDLEDLKRALAKSQQMLLQASICLEEYDELKLNFIPSSSPPPPSSQKEMVPQGEKEDTDSCTEGKSEKEVVNNKNENKNCNIDNQDADMTDYENIVTIDENENDHNVKEDADDTNGTPDVNVDIPSDIKNSIPNEIVDDDDDDNERTDTQSDDADVENNVTSEKDDDDEKLNQTNSNDTESNITPNESGKDNEESRSLDGIVETNVGNETQKPTIQNQQNTTKGDDKQRRIRNVGKESLLKAQAFLERLIEAWPDEE